MDTGIPSREYMQLDSDQQKIVQLKEGQYAVYAGAGSGKSTVLLNRVSELYGKGRVLCVTFTSEAAKSLRNRIQTIDPSITGSSVFCTLHSLGLRFAYDHAEAFPFKLADNVLADEGVAAKCVFDEIKDGLNYKAFTTWVSVQKRNRVSPAEAIIKAERTGKMMEYAICYKRYQASLKKLGLLDFDDLIYYMVDILETRPDIRQLWQYEWVMMDEAQDACELDWRMLQLITQKHKNLMCVGDAGQALFGFRGGIASHFLNMEKLFPYTTKLYLGNNYRSTQSIVDFGKKAYPYPEISEHFRPMKPELGVPPVITLYSTDYREAEETVKKVGEKIPSDCAILARTNLALRPLEEALLDAGIEYHILGDSGYWESPEVKNVLYWIRCCCTLSDNSILGALRTPFHPTRFLKKAKWTEEIKRKIDKGSSAWEAIGTFPELSTFRSFLGSLFKYQYLPPDEAISGILKDLRAVEHYKEEENISPDRNPVMNLKELIKASRRYGTLAEFVDFIRRLSYVNKQRKGVCLSTIHSAKGKEWPHVFFVSCNDGIVPHSKSENLEEEKACFFVGCSRAMDTLDISYYGQHSRFLEPWLVKEEDGVPIS